MTTKEKIKELIKKATGIENFLIETPSFEKQGDYASNIAFVLAKKEKKNPLEIAQDLKRKLDSPFFEKIEVAPPGFINFFLSCDYLNESLNLILKKKKKFGELKICKGEKVNVEFISANPTGPLTLGNGRGGFGGDVLSNILEKAGFKVTREYYINDVGNQINKLGSSILGTEIVYRGDYIEELRKRIKGKNPREVGEKAAKIILKEMIKNSVKKMGICFDVWFSEKSLYQKGEVDKAIADLTKRGFTYESEGALWFKSKGIGDDKDRVLIRKDGTKTYFASDIAYIRNKLKRGFKRVIILVGADHHGYVGRLKAAATALGIDQKKINVLIFQLVRVFEGGKEIRMSKRKGTYLTIDELIERIGLNAARFFFLEKSFDTHLTIDLDLVEEKSEKNPLFRVYYAYARINSILEKVKKKNIKKSDSFVPQENEERELAKQLQRFPEIIYECSQDFQLQRIIHYLLTISDIFHRFYEKCHVINAPQDLKKSRLKVLFSAKIIFEEIFDLIGIIPPKHM